MLGVGDECEVAGWADDGFPDCWFRARVTEVAPSGALSAPTAKVIFDDFHNSATGEAEVEHHATRSHRLRPKQPVVRSTLQEYQVSSWDPASRARSPGAQF